MRLFDIRISAGFYIGAALAVLLFPWNILFSFALAAGFHELCHLIALCCCHVSVQQMRLGPFGAVITTGPMLPGQELLCTAAGPAGSLFLVTLARWIPITALFGLAQGIFNLLPLYPFDGGRIIRCIFMLAKTARCDYNSPDYKQRGNNHD